MQGLNMLIPCFLASFILLNNIAESDAIGTIFDNPTFEVTTDDGTDDDRHDKNPDEYDATSAPSFIVSSAPSDEPCSASDGSFGSTTTNTIEVAYNYEMEVVKTADMEGVLSALETGVSNALLGSLFAGCSTGRRATEEYEQRLLIDSPIMGLSALPDDLETGTCSASGDEAKCSSIEGRLTVYMSTGLRRRLIASENVNKVAGAAIKTAMAGDLASVHPDIIGIKYLGDGTVQTTDDEEEDDNEDDGDVEIPIDNSSNTSNTPFVIGGVLSVGIVGGVAARAIWQRNRRSTENPSAMDNDEDFESYVEESFNDENLDDISLTSA